MAIELVNVKTKAGLDADIAAGNLKDTDIAFLHESGQEKMRTQGKDFNFVPSNGKNGQVLVSRMGKGVWESKEISESLYYGVEWQPNVADPALTRIGNLAFHKTLPIQSGMKGCVYNPKTKQVVYWLDSSNWKYKEGGNPDKGEEEVLARLDGYDGEVMIFIPEFWIKSWDTPTTRRVCIAPTKVDESWEHQPAVFIAAYRDTVLNSVPANMGYLSTLPVNSAISVVNESAYCRGGSNSSANDADADKIKRQLGKPRTNLARATFRTYARNAGKEIMSYRQYKNILYWLYVIEYANFNSQAAFNAALTAEGYHQGGLGAGVTTWDWTSWGNYNGYHPLTPCGYCNELGNGTGVKDLTAGTKVFSVPRWRGIDNPFGDVWHNVDGIIINSSSILKDGVKFSEVYTTDDPTKYSDSNYQAMDKAGEEYNAGEGYIKEFDLGSTGEIIPRSNGGNTTQYKCDYHYVNSATGLRTLLLGGCAYHGGFASLGYFYSGNGVGTADAYVGFRTSCVAV